MTEPVRTVFLAVTGMSPQVVTETLYALAHPEGAAAPVIPDEVHIITTSKGRALAVEHLLQHGQFAALLRDYPVLGQPQFGAENIHVIQTPEGAELPDICDPEENAWAADSITALLNRLTSDANSRLHVSISGGRKTMGFYVGYAFSLFARKDDALSHVLVSPAEFESSREFFFPPAEPHDIPLPGGGSISTAAARITLAHIPIVRLREGLPERLIAGDASYSATVAAIQLSFEEPHLVINLPDKRATCGSAALALRPISLAWLAWWAHLAQRGTPPRGWRDLARTPELRETLLAIYERILMGRAARLADALRDDLNDTRARLTSSDEADSRTFFQENNSKLARQMREQLGPAARHYLPQPSGKRPNTVHGLTLAPSQIEIVGLEDIYHAE